MELSTNNLTDEQIMDYINSYYNYVFVLGIDPFINCNLPSDNEDEECDG